MVHVIDRVLEPVAKVPQTILDILKNSGKDIAFIGLVRFWK